MFEGVTTLLVVFYGLVTIGYGFKKGGPPGACINLYPRHGYAPQTGNGGFKIDVSSTLVTAGEMLNVTLKGTQKIKGFIMRAERITGNTEIAIGIFQYVPEGVQKLAWYPEDNDWVTGLNCVTHSEELAVTSLKFTWRAPSDLKNMGDIRFRATVVTGFDKFYIKVISTTISTSSSSLPWSGTAKEIKFTTPPSVPEQCGHTIGCLVYPRWCLYIGLCTTFLSWESSLDFINFTMMAPATGYVSMGISPDTSMVNTQTLTCSWQENPKMIRFENGYNPPNIPVAVRQRKMNFRHPLQSGMKNIAVAKIGGNIYCNFTLPKKMTLFYETNIKTQNHTVTKTVTDLSSSFYFFITQGSLHPGTNVIKEHEGLPVTSDDKLDLSRNALHYGQAIPILIRLHGSLMILSWIVLNSLIMIIARYNRYMKQGFAYVVNGVPLWLQLHKWGSIVVYTVSFTAIIIIIVYAKGWANHTIAIIHGICGLWSMVFATAQVVYGLVRPDPTHPNRPMFTAVHKACALLCLATVIITILLTGFIHALPKSYKEILLGCTITWILINIIFVIVYEMLERRMKKEQEETCKSDQLNTMKIDDKEIKNHPKKKRIIIFINTTLLNILAIILFFNICRY